MKAVLSACALLVGISALGQTISYYNQGLLRQPDAATDRAYLGITPSFLGTNFLQQQITALTNAFQTNAWHLNGNALGGTGPFLGSTDNQPLLFKVNNVQFARFSTLPSVSVGPGANASFANSLAVGINSAASQSGSTALGLTANASAGGSTAIGNAAISSGLSSVAIGASSTASGDDSFASGTSAVAGPGQGAVALGFGNNALGNFAAAHGLGAVANNDGSFVWSDSNAAGYSDSAANQFIVYASGGIDLHAAGAGVFTDGPFNSTNTVNAYNATGSSFTYNAQANTGVAAGQSPLGNWGFISLDSSQTVNVAVKGTYYRVAAFQHAYTNRFGASLSTGRLTNTIAGWYRIGIGCSAAAPTANDAMDVDLMVNDVATEYIASHSTAPAGAPPKYITMAASGILYLSANSYLSIGITDTDNTGNITVLHAQLTIGSP